MNPHEQRLRQMERPLKKPGWCEEQGIAHAWESGSTLLSAPPIQTRQCANCGKVQWLRQPKWEDRP